MNQQERELYVAKCQIKHMTAKHEAERQRLRHQHIDSQIKLMSNHMTIMMRLHFDLIVATAFGKAQS